MPTRSRSSIDKLGERLRKSAEVSIADLQMLQEYRAEFRPAMEAVRSKLAALFGSEPSSRLKTSSTLIDKLVRDKTRLSSMQDIAGVRIVRDMRLDEQTAMAHQVAALFPGAKIDDRREKPSFGYRAVHVIVEEQSRKVEVQIRTELQHLWAFTFELMSNLWGRQVRYGGAPNSPEAGILESVPPTLKRAMEVDPRAPSSMSVKRADVAYLLRGVAAQIDALEQAQELLHSIAERSGAIATADRMSEDKIREATVTIRGIIEVVSHFFRNLSRVSQ